MTQNQQGVHESIFPRLGGRTKSKEAWDVLQQAYQGTYKINVFKLQSLLEECLRLLACRIPNLCKIFSLD